jgi:hypothetical protein
VKELTSVVPLDDVPAAAELLEGVPTRTLVCTVLLDGVSGTALPDGVLPSDCRC